MSVIIDCVKLSRKLKNPRSILLDNDMRVKITDFGTAKIVANSSKQSSLAPTESA